MQVFDPYDPPVIEVELEVTRCRKIRGEPLVEVWGYVGDYEVCLHLPDDDPRARSLRRHQSPPSAKRTAAQP